MWFLRFYREKLIVSIYLGTLVNQHGDEKIIILASTETLYQHEIILSNHNRDRRLQVPLLRYYVFPVMDMKTGASMRL